MSSRMLVAALLLCGAGCSETHTFNAQDIDVPPPGLGQLSAWQREEYRKDPKQVAHVELLGHLDVPWKMEPYHADTYTFFDRNPDRPEWGSYVTRGYVEPGRRRGHRRYRVKLRQHEGIWYAVQISRFIDVELDHPAMEGGHDH